MPDNPTATTIIVTTTAPAPATTTTVATLTGIRTYSSARGTTQRDKHPPIS